MFTAETYINLKENCAATFMCSNFSWNCANFHRYADNQLIILYLFCQVYAKHM